MKALAAYAFGGGFTLGVVRSGFEVVLHLEDGDFGVETSRANFPGLQVCTDPDHWFADAHEGRFELVYGNPPCAPWSNAATSPTKAFGEEAQRWKHDERTQCVWKMVDVWRKVRPRVWIWESVQSALTKGFSMVQDIAVMAVSEGYAFTAVLFDGYDVGVPQRRRRFFGVIHDVPIPWDRFPYPCPGSAPRTPREAFQGLPPGEALEVPPASTSFLQALAAAEPGGRLRDAYDRIHNPDGDIIRRTGRPGFMHRKLAWDEACTTQVGGPHLYHPEEIRRIAVEEARRLGGYPDDWVLPDSLSTNQKFAVMFKAVLPAAGEWISRYAKVAIEQNQPADPTARVIDFEKGRHELLLLP